METTIKIKSSIFPKEVIDQNEWMKMFNVSARVKETYTPSVRVQTIMSQYNQKAYHNMIKSSSVVKDKWSFMDALNKLLIK
jgi:hypothetical protein